MSKILYPRNFQEEISEITEIFKLNFQNLKIVIFLIDLKFLPKANKNLKY